MSSQSHSLPLFVYGTLKQDQPNHFLLTDPSGAKPNFIGRAFTIDCWPLVVTTPYAIPFLLDGHGTGKRVFGEVYKIDASLQKILDEFEGHPNFYTRVPISVELLDPCQTIDGPISSSNNGHSSSLGSRSVLCETYMLFNFKKDMLDLEFLECYTDDLLGHYIAPKDRLSGAPTAYSFVKNIDRTTETKEHVKINDSLLGECKEHKKNSKFINEAIF